jgi:hypothetical protein
MVKEHERSIARISVLILGDLDIYSSSEPYLILVIRREEAISPENSKSAFFVLTRVKRKYPDKTRGVLGG